MQNLLQNLKLQSTTSSTAPGIPSGACAGKGPLAGAS